MEKLESKVLKSHRAFGGLTQFWEHFSESTQTQMKFSTHVPSPSNGLSGSRNVKGCVIWLSGLTCTDENFISKAGAQKFLSDLDLMVVCPDTSPRGLSLPAEHESYDFGSGASFYVDATMPGYADHYQMETYVTEELVGLVIKQFGISSQKFSIMGHSMGGHGALTLGLRHPDKFQSVSAFAPIVNPSLVPWGSKAFRGYFGEDLSEWKRHDATELVKSGARHPRSILIDQGLADEFYEKQLQTKKFADACAAAGQKVEIHFREDYDHSYYFISTFIQSHLEFHAAHLQSSK